MAKTAKQKKIDREVKRLRELFQDLDPNKLAACDALIVRAAFITISLQELEIQLSESGWVETYQNGENQYGQKKAAAADVHISLTKNLNAIMKQLLDMVPPAARKSKLEELMGP